MRNGFRDSSHVVYPSASVTGIGAGAVALSVAAIATSVHARWRRREGPGAETWVLGAVVTLALVGISSSLLAVFGIFDRVALVLANVTLAALVWPWGPRRSARPAAPPQPRALRELGLLLLLVVGAVALRWPPLRYPFAGRDQGTYALRAETQLRTGRLASDDPILAAATADADGTRPGPEDVRGLWPRRPESWRRGRYEAGYRPGWYLADRDRGRVVPQFLHLHPSLMAVAGTIAGAEAMAAVVILEAALFVAVMFCLARRLFGSALVATLAAGVVVLDPLSIWVHRTTLTETVTALFFWGAVLAAVRTRDHEPYDLDTAALLLGALAWVRGNAWLGAPVVLAVLWLLPGRSPARRRPVAIYLAVTAAGVIAHASTSFPYLVDELRKQLGTSLLPAPETLAAGAVLGAVAWLLVDRFCFHDRIDGRVRAFVRRVLPTALGVAAAVAVLAYAWMRAASPPMPASRLDPAIPLFGATLLACAALAVPRVVARAELTRARDVWLAAAAALVVVTLGLYAQRNLPQAGLFYYGRYLTPELLPACALLAAATVDRLRTAGLYRRIAAAALGLLLLGLAAAPLVRDPVVRLREFEGGQRLVDRIAAAVPADAVVVAGGEGWHHGHTFNQVGGALQMGHGRSVLPYTSREAFYATAYELLVGRPEAEGIAAPPLYLLLGEATHHYRREQGGTPLAAIDDLLPPPFVAREIALLELFTDRLTPVTGEMPTRVTRDELRMALVRIDVDPDRAGERRFRFRGPDPPSGLELAGSFELTEHGLCFDRHETVTIHFTEGLPLGPGSIVLVATPGTAEVNAKLSIAIDDVARSPSPPQTGPRPADTLGPFPIASAPAKVAIQGFARSRDAACPYGGLAELRVLDVDRPALAMANAEATTLAPARDLGHPVEPTLWVGGRGLSRYRPGIEPAPEIEALSIVVTEAEALRFADEPLPAAGQSPIDVIVTLTGAKVGPDTRLVVSVDDLDVLTIDPPDELHGTWQSVPQAWTPAAPVVRFGVRLDGAQAAERVLLRDIGLFSRGPVVASRLAGQ